MINIIYPVIIDIFCKTLRKNAQEVFERLSNICTQHKCQIHSMFVSYTLPLSPSFISICYSFMHTTAELTVHLAALTVRNVERCKSIFRTFALL